MSIKAIIDMVEIERKDCFVNIDGEPELVNRKRYRALTKILDSLKSMEQQLKNSRG